MAQTTLDWQQGKCVIRSLQAFLLEPLLLKLQQGVLLLLCNTLKHSCLGMWSSQWEAIHVSLLQMGSFGKPYQELLSHFFAVSSGEEVLSHGQAV